MSATTSNDQHHQDGRLHLLPRTAREITATGHPGARTVGLVGWPGDRQRTEARPSPPPPFVKESQSLRGGVWIRRVAGLGRDEGTSPRLSGGRREPHAHISHVRLDTSVSAGLPGGELLRVVHWIARSAPYLAALVVAAGAVAVWRSVQRGRRVAKALADRVTVEIVPTSTFDPGESEVGRWARQVGRVRYAAAGTPARGAAARLRYSVVDGAMRCYLEGPAEAAAVLAMPGFAEVEVRASRAERSVQPVRFEVPAPRGGER